MIADITTTKALSKEKHERFIDMMDLKSTTLSPVEDDHSIGKELEPESQKMGSCSGLRFE